MRTVIGTARIAAGIAEYAARHAFDRVADLTGALDTPRG